MKSCRRVGRTFQFFTSRLDNPCMIICSIIRSVLRTSVVSERRRRGFFSFQCFFVFGPHRLGKRYMVRHRLLGCIALFHRTCAVFGFELFGFAYRFFGLVMFGVRRVKLPFCLVTYRKHLVFQCHPSHHTRSNILNGTIPRRCIWLVILARGVPMRRTDIVACTTQARTAHFLFDLIIFWNFGCLFGLKSALCEILTPAAFTKGIVCRLALFCRIFATATFASGLDRRTEILTWLISVKRRFVGFGLFVLFHMLVCQMSIGYRQVCYIALPPYGFPIARKHNYFRSHM
mmetsp:Transcript_8149/g.15773  ORF Transcript_8149/g.15773 Transcript_8149/m.15773 type:complete len:288 (-) Transcript_8149:1004-1867(-)